MKFTLSYANKKAGKMIGLNYSSVVMARSVTFIQARAA